VRIEVKNRYARELLAAIDSTPVTKFANRLRSVLALIPQSGDMCLAKAAGAWRCRYAGELDHLVYLVRSRAHRGPGSEIRASLSCLESTA